MTFTDTAGRRTPAGYAWMAAAMAGLVLIVSVGCSQHPMEPGFSDQGRTQLQFFSPPGATVTVKDCPPRSHQIAQYGPFDNRLEQSPEEFCVFNLPPGRYEFKYVSADGLPGVSVYGELIVKYANSHGARVFQRRAFVPIALPSEYYKKTEISGDEIFPYRGEAFRTAIDENDLQRLRQGDVIEKVFFVADLEDASKTRDWVETELKVIERKLEYADARFRLAYYDFRNDVNDPLANLFRTDRKFIKWEEERQELLQKQERLEKKMQRLESLLKGDRQLSRKDMLVLATSEIVPAHRDAVDSSDDLGEVLLVMRIGGRHMQWGEPARELAVYGE